MDNLAGYVGDSDFEFAIGGGTKITFYKEKRIKWGMVAQFAYYKPDYDTVSYSIAGHNATFSTEAEVFEFQLAAGPKINLSQGVSIYGGPMFHYVDVDVDFKGNIDGSPGTVDTSGDVDSGFGGYAGIQIDLDKKTDLNVEFQLTADGYCVGSQLIWRF